eukprot:m.17242 g.17242  ORF g.17242 m.17242 type:complete len:1165 (+) comp5427_c0_seq1:383-3877(+)
MAAPAMLQLDDLGPNNESSTDHDDAVLFDQPSSVVSSTSTAGGASQRTPNHGDAEEHRIVYINLPPPEDTPPFLTNWISTAKYGALTFVPKFLFEQFSRYANVFFLFASCIQQVDGVSPTGRYTTIVPLSLILIVTAIKELLEDWKRHRADDEVNHRLVKVLSDGVFVSKRWTEVVVGDVVKVLNGQFFPADLVLLSSSEPQAMCYIETANLDGETNLKIRQGLSQTSHITSTRDARLFQATLECEPPNNRLYKFVGNLETHEDGRTTKLPLNADQLLLRGAQLRNTPWVFGIVAYTGHESKLLKNTTAAPIKRSNVDVVANTQIVFLFFVLVFLAFICTIANKVWFSHHDSDWYFAFGLAGPQNFVLTFLTFMILFNNLIPISLIVTIEMVKFVQALTFINHDLEMYDEESDTPARARTSALNEELGQVQYIFSDKTGTLTQNKMQFLKCTIAGIVYGDVVVDTPGPSGFGDPALLDNLTSGHQTASVIREWLTLLAVCHTVVPERDRENPDVIVYQAASPDERALVEAVKRLGFSFNVRTPEGVVINALGQEERYDILNVLEFDSTRKRMSVIVRTPQGQIKLYCKGADTVIYERLAPRQPFADSTTKHLEAFATDGLRTLCLAVAQISEEQYASWSKVYEKAAQAIEGRAEKLAKAAEMIEKDLFLLGATAIEDKLQDGVPDTIRSLARAGIKIWVLTGDKQETAINVGFACKVLTNQMELMICNSESPEGALEFIQEKLQFSNDMEPEKLALIVDGQGLLHCLSEDLRSRWLRLAKRCKAVICCRVSPLQKADVVRLVKKSDKAITLAIGDGANDVGMIQAAHVGVGISGQEGLQAARAADYSIGQFKFLKRLLLVHGGWSYYRLSTLILYFFYKNMAMYIIQFWYAPSNGFSGQILFERWNIASYNVIFALLPPLAIGVFDQHVSAESLLAVPQLYMPGLNGERFNSKRFWLWVLNAMFHSNMIFWLSREANKFGNTHEDGTVNGLWYLGVVVYGIMVYTVTLKAAMILRNWTTLTHVAIWLSMGLWFVWSFFYMEIYITNAFGGIAREVYGVDRRIYGAGSYWFTLFLLPVITLLLDYTLFTGQKLFFPTAEDLVREKELRGTLLPEMEPTVAMTDSAREARNKHSGYAFSQNEADAVVTQTQVIRSYDTTVDKPLGE